jgi:serine/threonine protein kinase
MVSPAAIPHAIPRHKNDPRPLAVKTLPPLRELAANRPPPRVPDHELLRCIGRGSYGEVWLARTTLDTYRAVKVMYRSDFEDARPFEHEYTGIRKFEPVSRSHEGLVDILQVGRNDQEGYFYYVMELADDVAPVFKPANQIEPAGPTSPTGKSALHRSACVAPVFQPASTPTGKSALQPDSYSPSTLSAERRLRSRLPARECVALGVSLSGALAQLHRHGLIHRDIKPSNIIFVGGKAKLADIGLVTDEAEPLSYVGTEGFIPPEGPNSPQADVFSLGKVLYEVSMGKDRLDFPEPATALEELPDRDELLELNSILLKACQPDRRQRYPSADEMHAELEMLHQGKSVREKRNREQRLRWMAVASVCVAAMTLAALGLERVLDWRSRALQGQSSTIHPSPARLLLATPPCRANSSTFRRPTPPR